MKSILIFTICIIIAIAAQYHGENNFNNKYYTQEIINLRFQKQSLMNRLEELERQYRKITTNSSLTTKIPLEFGEIKVEWEFLLPHDINFTISCEDQIVRVDYSNDHVVIKKSNHTLSNYIHCDKCDFSNLENSFILEICHGGGFINIENKSVKLANYLLNNQINRKME